MLTVHWVCSLLSYAAFLVACAAAALFLVQERQLKRKRMGWWFHRLPSLDALDRVNMRAIGVGFALLSLGLVAGLLEARARMGAWWHGDPKEVLAVAVWASYLLLWVVRLRATLRGRKVALLSILSFTLVLFTFLGVRSWLPTWHAYL